MLPIFLKKPPTFFWTFSAICTYSFSFYEPENPPDVFFSIFFFLSSYLRSSLANYFYFFYLYFCISFSTFFLPFYAKNPKSSFWYSWTNWFVIAMHSLMTMCSLMSCKCSRTTVNSFSMMKSLHEMMIAMAKNFMYCIRLSDEKMLYQMRRVSNRAKSWA